MKTNLKKIDKVSSKLFILPFFEGESDLSVIQSELDKKFNNVIKDNILNNFDAKINETMIFPLPDGNKILALGLGKKDELTIEKYKIAISKGFLAIQKYIKDNVAIELVKHNSFDVKKLIASIIVAIGINDYKFDKYITNKKPHVDELEIIANNINEEMVEICKRADIINNSMTYTKDLVFESAQVMTPKKVSEIALSLAKDNCIDIKIYNKDELKEMNFNTFLAVGQGSINEPKFIHLTYKSKNPKKKIVLIGKGITFDSGGLDIKPASSMLTMKTDMTGCATVLGVMKAISEIKPEIELHCMSALCENMPSGSSYKVGDVIKTKSGKTVEVDNTDAEGRLTLADVLTYADEIQADEVIDIATLTGAVIVALGDNITGILGNNQNQIEEFKKAADETGERVWQLPIYDDLMDNLKSDIADMSNTGGRNAGASTAARFLQNYTKSNSWLHIDIAGTAFTDKPHGITPKGATGVMVRTLVKYLIK